MELDVGRSNGIRGDGGRVRFNNMLIRDRGGRRKVGFPGVGSLDPCER